MKVSLPDLIGRGRRRLLRNALAFGGARAICAAAGGFVLLLVLGADVVDWRWLVALLLLAFAAGAFRAWRRRPTAYATAQLLDSRLHLADTLSTAIFYWPRHCHTKCDEVVRRRQREYAARVASGVDLRAALPLRIPRPLVSCLTALALLAISLAVLRYRLEGKLDLHRPALPGLEQWVRDVGREIATIEPFRRAGEKDRKPGARGEDDKSARESFATDSSDAGSSKDGEAVPQAEELSSNGKKSATEAGRQTTENQAGGSRQQEAADNATDSRNDGDAQSGDSQSSGRNAAQPGTSAGLLAKLSNSLANLTSAFASKVSRGQEGRDGQNGPSGKGLGTAKAPSKSAPDSHGAPENGARGAGDAGDLSTSDAGENGTSGSSANPDQRGGSSAGSDDGSKRIQLAKELEAMGKISVILGKRSQAVSGSASLDVTSGHGELTTRYEPRQATHTAVASAEGDRIPIDLETYVQQYFRELRKRTGHHLKNAP